MSSPTQSGRDVSQDRFDDVRVVCDSKSVRYGQQKCICFGDCLITFQLFDEHVGLGSIRAAKHRSHIVDEADLIAALVPTEVGSIAIGRQRKDRSRDRHAWLARMAGIIPRFPENADLPSLLYMKRLTGFVFLQGGALQVHAMLRGPDGSRVGS